MKLVLITEDEYIDLVTSYDFLTSLTFNTVDEVITTFQFFEEYNRLSNDVNDYLLDKLNELKNVETREYEKA